MVHAAEAIARDAEEKPNQLAIGEPEIAGVDVL